MSRHTFNIQVPVAVFKRTQYWIAYCPHLKTFGYSEVSSEEALKDFDGAIKTFFYVHVKLNTVEKALLKLGWSSRDGEYDPPKYFNVNVDELRGIKSTQKSREVQIPVC